MYSNTGFSSSTKACDLAYDESIREPWSERRRHLDFGVIGHTMQCDRVDTLAASKRGACCSVGGPLEAPWMPLGSQSQY